LSSTPEFTETQLAAARAKAWHQDGDPLLTFEAARDFITASGLILFAPRSLQLPAPAPSLVEATLGGSNPAPTMAASETARGFVARLTGEGLALPLNLMALPGDTPDFVVSAQVFSYIFTLRGDKAWKQAPSTSGAVKVSPLSLRVYEVLTERGAGGMMTAPELANELGREVTEAAILRALSELWSQLRVLPLLQLGGAPTLWELSTRRFTKAIKAGANAGLPSALSALISLYLAQVLTATEEEVTTFLSPLTARSRVREVLHALVGARQLETVVVEGKTLLHIPGTLPAFAALVVEGGVEVDAAAEDVAAIPRPKKIGTGRISSFTSERKTASDFRGKPARAFKSAAASKYGPRLDGKSEPARRPFKKDGAAPTKRTFTKPSFSKPWNEDKRSAPRKAAAPDAFTKFRRPAPEDREPLAPREQAGLPVEKRTYTKAKPSFDRPAKPAFDRAAKSAGFAKRPFTPRSVEGGAKPFAAKRPYTPRTSDDSARPFTKRPYTPRTTEDGERTTFKPRSYEGAGKTFTKRPYAPRTNEGGGAEKSFAKPLAAKRPYTPRAAEDGAKPFAKRPYAAKTPYASKSAEAGERPYAKRPYTPRTSTPDATTGSFPKRAYKPRTEGASPGSFPKRAYTPRPAADDSTDRRLPKRPYKPRAADADARPFNKTPWTPPADDRAAKPKRTFKPRGEGSFARAGAGPSKPFGSKPGGKFSRPFGKSGTKAPARKKPGADA
jgi:23S rRNA pseudouridine2605 synthase